jgi:hypothetical protein
MIKEFNDNKTKRLISGGMTGKCQCFKSYHTIWGTIFECLNDQDLTTRCFNFCCISGKADSFRLTLDQITKLIDCS